MTDKMEMKARAMYSISGCHFSEINKVGERIIRENESELLRLMQEILKTRKDTDVITLADYGTADAGTILPLMNNLIGSVRKIKGPSQEINVILEDHCYNDFNALVSNVVGKHDNNGLQISDNVHVLISPTSMYQQCLPRDSLDFGFCITASHWLSECKWKVKDNIFFQPDNPVLFQAVHAQANRDWRNFVIKRGIELKKGGSFFASCVSLGIDGIMNLVLGVYRQMIKERIITEDELENTNGPFFAHKSEEDWISVFADDNPDVKHLGLRLISSKVYEYECWPYNPRDNQSDDYLANRAAAITKVIKSWLHNIIYCGLSEDRSEAERIATTQCLFDRIEKKILVDGPRFRYSSTVADIVFQKNDVM